MSLFKSAILTVYFLLVAVVCGACNSNHERPLEAGTEKSLPSLKEEAFQAEDVIEGAYWKIFSTKDRYGYAMYDTTGHEFFRDLHPRGMFGLRQISDTLIVREFSAGNETGGMQYFDVERRLYSSIYWNVLAIDYGKVAYLSADRNWLIVHDIFDSAKDFTCFKRPFYKFSILQMADEHSDQMTVSPFSVTEFLEESRLHVIYLSENEKFVEEILELT